VAPIVSDPRDVRLIYEQNILKAKKELERLEAEESSAAPAAPAVNGHGETKATAPVAEGESASNEVEDVAADVKAASLEDKE
jgi:hypothetical protein